MSSQTTVTMQQMKCAGCGKEAGADLITLMSCGACFSVSYCSSECQRAGWPGHKAECNQKKLCAGCGKKASADFIMKSCSACKTVSYCSTDCQRTSWKEHRAACNEDKHGDGSGVGIIGTPPSTTSPLSSTVKRYDIVDCYNACAHDRPEDLQKILEQGGIDINCARLDNGHTAVHAAAEKGHDKCLAELIRHGGADLSKMTNNGYASIHTACVHGRVACLRLLLDNGINANVRTGDDCEYTPAVICCTMGHVKCLALLLDRGSDPNLATVIDNSTPAHAACNYDQIKCLQLLLARGANFNAVDSDGKTPLDYARGYGHVDCVELLIEYHAVGQRAEDLLPVSEADKESNAECQKKSEALKEKAKRCDYPPCNASAADKNLAALYKCSRCGEGRYCCHVHGILDWDRHKLLCNDIKLKVGL